MHVCGTQLGLDCSWHACSVWQVGLGCWRAWPSQTPCRRLRQIKQQDIAVLHVTHLSILNCMCTEAV
jgi:hypothetical protein